MGNQAIPGNVEKNPTFHAQYEQHINKINEPVDGKAEFISDADKNIHALATDIYKNKPEQVRRYEEKIKRSLASHLKDDVTIDILWQAMKNEGCSLTEIIGGILRFFKVEKVKNTHDKTEQIQKVEISITRFLKPIQIPATSEIQVTYEQSRERAIENTKKDLMALLDEINLAVPNLPIMPS
jgi:hypothetical protein